MKAKKYYMTKCDDLERELDKQRLLSGLKDKVIKFLLAAPNPYRVELTPDASTISSVPYNIPITYFTYVDNKGSYHNYYKPIARDKIEVVSTNAETAVFRVTINKDHPVYWILNKADETMADMPEEFFCHRGAKLCEIKETPNE